MKYLKYYLILICTNLVFTGCATMSALTEDDFTEAVRIPDLTIIVSNEVPREYAYHLGSIDRDIIETIGFTYRGKKFVDE